MSDTRTRVAENFFRSFFGGDVAAAADLLDPNVVYMVPGGREPSGVFRGATAVTEHLATFLRLTENVVDVLAWEDWLAGVNFVAALVRIHLQRAGQLHDFRVIYLVSVAERDGNDLITSIEAFYNDQPAFNRFFAVEP